MTLEYISHSPMKKRTKISTGFGGSIMIKSVLPLIFLSLSITSGCKHDTDLDAIPDVKFSEVQGILSGSCGSSNCHGDNADEFSLIGYDNVINNGEVEAGNAGDSKLYEVITATDEDIMPPSPRSPLSDANIKKIYYWIEKGAKNN